MSSHSLPEVLMKKVDEYVDSLAPQIQPRIAQELELFQKKTIDSLEDQVVDAFRSLFDKDDRKTSSGSGSGSRSLNDRVPDSYGGQSLPFADEIAGLTRGLSNIAGDAGDDLRDIFNLTEGRDGTGETTRSRGGGGEQRPADNFKGFFSAAVHAVQDHLDDRKGSGGGGDGGFQLDGLLGVISNTVKEAAQNPEEKARVISPEIKEKVGEKLRQQHAPIAEQFTRIALDHIKRWLRGNTSSRDLGDGVKGEIEGQVKDLVKGLGGLFRHKKEHSQGGSREIGDHDEHEERDRDRGDGEGSGGGFSKIISEKLSTGLARVHREVRLEFRKILGAIEKQLFELLPDQFQRPLEKILGGNPFDSQLDRDAKSGGQADRGFGDDIKAKLLDKIRGLIRKVQETLRESILGVVNGGHRKFESESWVFVQNMVEQKVQKYLPKVKITVPDDIGNEGVSVGAPTSNVQLGGGHQPVPAQGGHAPPAHHQSPPQNQPSHQEYKPPVHQPEYQQQHEYRPHEEHRPQDYQAPQHSQQGYRPQGEYRPPQEHRPQQYQQDHHQEYQPQEYRPQDYASQPAYQTGPPQNESHHQGYQSGQHGDYQGGHQQGGYQQGGHQQDHQYGQGPRY